MHFLAACFEYVAFASELPASDARVATMSGVLRECQLAAGPYDHTDEGRSDESGFRHRHRVELLIMWRFNRVVPWRDFELLRRSTRRVLLFTYQQGAWPRSMPNFVGAGRTSWCPARR